MNAIQSLTCKFDDQADLIQTFEWPLKENTESIVKIKELAGVNTSVMKGVMENVEKLKKQVMTLQKEYAALCESCLELASSEMLQRWSLCLNGVPERGGGDIREEVVGILSKVVPLSAEQLRNTVDTVHRPGQKTRADRPRPVILQFSMRTIHDPVWKMSKNASICNELKIRFREDYCKED